MRQEGLIRNFIGLVDVFAVGSPISLDSHKGDVNRTLYYELEGTNPYEEISFDQSPLFISEPRTIAERDPIVFPLYNSQRLILPGGRTVIEKLTNPSVEGDSYIAHMEAGLSASQIAQINALDGETKMAVLSDLYTNYPRFIVTQGNIFEGYLGSERAFFDSAGVENTSRVFDGFAKPYVDDTDGQSTWKIAKEYPQKKGYERVVMSMGLEYNLPENNPEATSERENAFVRAMEVGGKDAREMLGRIARPSFEIRRQSLYDIDPPAGQ